jgi:hypothetical protein
MKDNVFVNSEEQLQMDKFNVVHCYPVFEVITSQSFIFNNINCAPHYLSPQSPTLPLNSPLPSPVF